VTLGAKASADVSGVGHTFTLDDSAGLGGLMLDGSAMTADLKVLAGAGTDAIVGGSGNDTFFASLDNDIFTGGAGSIPMKAGCTSDRITPRFFGSVIGGRAFRRGGVRAAPLRSPLPGAAGEGSGETHRAIFAGGALGQVGRPTLIQRHMRRQSIAASPGSLTITP